MPSTNEQLENDVAVIGCGLMGAALARTFASSGRSVVVWNRTPERAEAIAGERISAVRDVVDAVRSAELIVACTTSYDTTLAALAPVDDWRGKTLVNLATGTPDEAESLERWATDRGAAYLDGTIFAYPKEVGTADAMFVFSGSPAVWSSYEHALMTLGGRSRYVSERVGNSNVLFVGVNAFYIGAMSAHVEAASYILSQGTDAATLRDIYLTPLRALDYVTEEMTEAIANDSHETDQATIDTYLVGGRSAVAAVQGAGHHARVFAAAVEYLQAAHDAGLGELGFSAQARVAAVDDISE